MAMVLATKFNSPTATNTKAMTTVRRVPLKGSLETGFPWANHLLTKATELARTFTAKPPQALRMTKRLMKSAQRLELADFLDLCSSYQASCHHTQDYRRAINGFLDKTTVEFKGD